MHAAGLFAPLPWSGSAAAAQHALQKLPFLISANFALEAEGGRQLCGLHDSAPAVVDASQVSIQLMSISTIIDCGSAQCQLDAQC